jgi:hypothetical protein
VDPQRRGDELTADLVPSGSPEAADGQPCDDRRRGSLWRPAGRRPTFGWTLTGAICLVLAFASWLALVAPVNRIVAAAQSSGPGSVPAM